MSAFESIATATVTSGVTTLTFSSIPTTFQHLHLRMYTRSTVNNGDTDFTYILLNGSSTAYAFRKFGTTGASPNYRDRTGNTAYFITERTPSASVTADVFQVGYFDIMDYRVSGKKRSGNWQTGFVAGVGSTNFLYWLENGNGMWNAATSAVTSITLGLAYGVNFSTGTTVALYGIKST